MTDIRNRIDELKALVSKGYNDRMIAEKWGYKRRYIAQIRQENNIAPCSLRNWCTRNIKIPSKYKLAYIAGLFDGEGSILLSKHYKPWIAMETTSFEVLSWLDKELGLKGAYIYKCPHRNTNAKPKRALRIGKFKNIEQLLIHLMPFLIIKKRQAQLLLEFVQLRLKADKFTRTSREDEIFLELKQLNKRGPL